MLSRSRESHERAQEAQTLLDGIRHSHKSALGLKHVKLIYITLVIRFVLPSTRRREQGSPLPPSPLPPSPLKMVDPSFAWGYPAECLHDV